MKEMQLAGSDYFHPTTWLCGWIGMAILLPLLSWDVIIMIAICALAVAFLWEKARFYACALLLRTRWLLLSIAILFTWSTPGTPLPNFLGSSGGSIEGAWFAAEHILRLVTLLMLLASIHALLGMAGLVTGIYGLLWPLAYCPDFRKRIVVRLLLVIEIAEGARQGQWKEWLQGASGAGLDNLEQKINLEITSANSCQTEKMNSHESIDMTCEKREEPRALTTTSLSFSWQELRMQDYSFIAAFICIVGWVSWHV